ncbi:T9SS type A sorting domain-containing protein [Aequorivita todarodis]|uniref:T9SS type A sorting domain-containing protein n=1 Tax=Aequorivita todarodis TaxID=2036821 RepID=UPI00234FD25A|nr:T9SS type A sorting domain-containing protein [Aequorivita todarodis]MDC8001807.1 T9SS type A sorting domain-containing protein [Aequorivita todarodis]
MKKITLLLLLIGSCAFAQYTVIPDPNFEQALIDLGYDTVLDGQVLTDNIDGVLELDVFDKNINDMTGIQDFSALESLWAGYNNYTSIDLSQNMNLEFLNLLPSQPLTALDISANVNLEVLQFGCPSISYVDVTNNSNLKEFYCLDANLTQVDVSQNPLLESLRIRNNQITGILDLSNNPLLTVLECSANLITAIDVTNCPNLEYLICWQNLLSSLDISQNLALDWLSCSNNQLTQLEFTANQAITQLSCKDNQLTDLDISPLQSLISVDCSGNPLTDLDLTSSPTLSDITCNNTTLQTIDTRNGNNGPNGLQAIDNPNLTCVLVEDINNIPFEWDVDPRASFGEDETQCNTLMDYTLIPDMNFEQALIDLGYDTAIDGKVLTANIETVTQLDVSEKGIAHLNGIQDFTTLQNLDCGTNDIIGTLNISHNINLKEVKCWENDISNINTSNNPQMETFLCGWNPNLNSLDLSNYPSLTALNVTDTNIFYLDLSNNPSLEIFYGLGCNLYYLDLRNGNNNNITTLDVTQNPSLTCIYVDDVNNIPSTWLKDNTATYVETEAECSALDVTDSEKPLSFALYPNPTDHFLNIKGDLGEIVNDIKIYNISGQELLRSKASDQLNVSQLSAGVYLIIIETDEGVVRKRFVKK